MRNRFDRQLHLLDEQLTHMGELCETAIAKATQALKDGSIEQAKVIIAEDEEIDQIEKDIERLCLKLLLQQQPVAKDLRSPSAAARGKGSSQDFCGSENDHRYGTYRRSDIGYCRDHFVVKRSCGYR